MMAELPKEESKDMAPKSTGMYLFIALSFIATVTINLISTVSTTWSFLILPTIGFFIVRPRWVEGISFFFLMTFVKFTIEFLLNDRNLPMDLLLNHFINTGVNFIIFITVGFFIRKNHKLMDELQSIAVIDTLTGAFNRRYMEMYYSNLKKGSPHTLLLLDIDHFKCINDTFGHHYGDVVLKRYVKIMKEIIKDSGVVFRVGGEEFAVIFPNTTLGQGYLLAEKIRTKIENTVFHHKDKKMKITNSGGIAEFNSQDIMEDVIYLTDISLYEAKRNGRNKVCVAHSNHPTD